MVWTVSAKIFLMEVFQRHLPNLFQVRDDQEHYIITIHPTHCGLAGVAKGNLIHFDVI